MEIQSPVLYAMPKSSSTSESYSPTQRQSLHHLQPQSQQREIHPRFQQFPNQTTLNKIMKHKHMINYTKIIEYSNTSSSKTNWKVVYRES